MEIDAQKPDNSAVLDMLAGFQNFVYADPSDSEEERELGIIPVYFTKKYKELVFNMYQEAADRINGDHPEDQWVVLESLLPRLKELRRADVYQDAPTPEEDL